MVHTRRVRKSKAGPKQPLAITGNLQLPTAISGWERELLLPVVVPLVEAVWREAEAAQRAEGDDGSSS